MSPDDLFVSFLSISLASIFLALVIGTRGSEIRKVASSFGAEALPTRARRKGRIRQIERKVEIANEAIRARARGERFVPPSDYRRAV